MRHLSSSALLWLLVAPRRAVRKHAFFSRRRERRRGRVIAAFDVAGVSLAQNDRLAKDRRRFFLVVDPFD